MSITPQRLRSFVFGVVVAMLIVLNVIAVFEEKLFSQSEAKVDFSRDLQPLLKQRCVACHGPSQQMSGYRLDRRSAALGGVLRPNIIPGSSESSRLYRRLIGSQFGPQMPPAGALTEVEIGIFKRWVDEGAEWPDALANESAVIKANPAVTRMTDLIRLSDRRAVLKQLKSNPSLVNGRGPGGLTPLMYAALYADAGLVAEMLQAGADVNIRNEVGATALMWAVDDVEKVRVLLRRGADVNATSDFGRTPLMLAAAQAASAPVVKLLLENGSTPNPAALTSAVSRCDVTVVRLLLGAGARDTGAARAAALRSNCRQGLDAIVSTQGASPMPNALLDVLPPSGAGNPEAVREAMERGADVNASDAKSRTVLMLAAVSETISPDSVRLLIDRGADPYVKSPDGFTALDFAKRLGRTPVVDILAHATGTTASDPEPGPTVVEDNSIRDAVERAVPLLQRTALQFYKKSGCLSCHHNALTAMTVAAVRRKGLTVDESSARQELATVTRDIDATRDQALQGIVSPGGSATTIGYLLMGLSAERHQSDAATDAMVRLLKLSQRADGRWPTAYRPPAEASEITSTAVSLRGIQLYGRNQGKRTDSDVIRAARSWLQTAYPQTTEDRVFRLFGLTWAGASNTSRQSAIRDLASTQRADGGWSQLPSLPSDAYATGEALVALHEAGIRPDDASYRRGARFLLKTQLVDGSWFVRTRSHATQVYFESGFPHGAHQYISAAATNWATLALALAYQQSVRH
jgi:ankyrin repeat protein